jgi:hypothetical protein
MACKMLYVDEKCDLVGMLVLEKFKGERSFVAKNRDSFFNSINGIINEQSCLLEDSYSVCTHDRIMSVHCVMYYFIG